MHWPEGPTTSTRVQCLLGQLSTVLHGRSWNIAHRVLSPGDSACQADCHIVKSGVWGAPGSKPTSYRVEWAVLGRTWATYGWKH